MSIFILARSVHGDGASGGEKEKEMDKEKDREVDEDKNLCEGNIANCFQDPSLISDFF